LSFQPYFSFVVISALTVRFLTKRFIGEYQSLMRKYVCIFAHQKYLPTDGVPLA